MEGLLVVIASPTGNIWASCECEQPPLKGALTIMHKHSLQRYTEIAADGTGKKADRDEGCRVLSLPSDTAAAKSALSLAMSVKRADA